MLQKVIKRFAIISGLQAEEVSKWSFLCCESLDYVLSHTVIEDISEYDENRLCSLASAVAYYKLALYDFDGVSSFTAGDVHITKECIQKQAERIMQSEINSCCDITDLGGACFMGVMV